VLFKLNFSLKWGIREEMKKELMEILACPMCKGDLELSVEEEEEKEKGEIVTGSLYCRKCDLRYPIEEGIPNLLPPELRQGPE